MASPKDFLTWRKVIGFKAVSQVLVCSIALMSCIIINKLLFHSVFWEMMGLEQYIHSSSLPYPSRLFSELLLSCTSLTAVCLCLVMCLWGIWSRNIDGFYEGWRAGKEERDINLQCHVVWWLLDLRTAGWEGPRASLLQAVNASLLLFLRVCASEASQSFTPEGTAEKQS